MPGDAVALKKLKMVSTRSVYSHIIVSGKVVQVYWGREGTYLEIPTVENFVLLGNETSESDIVDHTRGIPIDFVTVCRSYISCCAWLVAMIQTSSHVLLESLAICFEHGNCSRLSQVVL